ncbi:MAG: hypothetical protein C0503_01930 [Gemmatimonas sp.]|nr:hypothetical protein [Gemmatimonas sp.]
MMVESSIFATKELRASWPRLAAVWARQYPLLFDAQDLRLTRTQPKNHFAEWFTAVHVFQVEGVRSLVQKYLYHDAHPEKAAVLRRILKTPDLERLRALCDRHKCQPPDLLLFNMKHQLAGFIEVKGPKDRLKPSQRSLLPDLEQAFGVPVRLVHVRVVAG